MDRKSDGTRNLQPVVVDQKSVVGTFLTRTDQFVAALQDDSGGRYGLFRALEMITELANQHGGDRNVFGFDFSEHPDVVEKWCEACDAAPNTVSPAACALAGDRVFQFLFVVNDGELIKRWSSLEKVDSLWREQIVSSAVRVGNCKLVLERVLSLPVAITEDGQPAMLHAVSDKKNRSSVIVEALLSRFADVRGNVPVLIKRSSLNYLSSSSRPAGYALWTEAIQLTIQCLDTANLRALIRREPLGFHEMVIYDPFDPTGPWHVQPYRAFDSKWCVSRGWDPRQYAEIRGLMHGMSSNKKHYRRQLPIIMRSEMAAWCPKVLISIVLAYLAPLPCYTTSERRRRQHIAQLQHNSSPA